MNLDLKRHLQTGQLVCVLHEFTDGPLEGWAWAIKEDEINRPAVMPNVDLANYDSIEWDDEGLAMLNFDELPTIESVKIRNKPLCRSDRRLRHRLQEFGEFDEGWHLVLKEGEARAETISGYKLSSYKPDARMIPCPQPGCRSWMRNDAKMTSCGCKD